MPVYSSFSTISSSPLTTLSSAKHKVLIAMSVSKPMLDTSGRNRRRVNTMKMLTHRKYSVDHMAYY